MADEWTTMESTVFSNWTTEYSTLTPTILNFTLESNYTASQSNVSLLSGKSRGVAIFQPIIVTEMILSIICLILVILVYSVLPEFRNVHGKNLISLSSCLLTSFLFLCLDLILRNHISAGSCFTIGMIIHVSFLATFFWTNVMAFDIWRTMANLKPHSEFLKKTNKYCKYSVYAWSATILVAFPAALLDRTDLVPLGYRPKFGVRRCWLSGTRAFVLYFNGPVGIILLSNLVMFLLTLRSLFAIKKLTEKLHVKQQQRRFNLYLKLFLVMGIIWITEFLPWATGIYMLYALAGILTSLYGVLLFIIFVCKRRILRQIKEKYGHICSQKKPAMKKFSASQPTLSTSANSSEVSKV